MLEVKGLSVTVNQTNLLNDVSFSAPLHQITGILGANGAGKSTLLKAIMGQIDATGDIVFFSHNMASYNTIERAKKLAFVSQHESIDARIKVIDYVLLGRLAHQNCLSSFNEVDYEIALKALAYFDAETFVKKPFQTLSGGERQRVQLSRALCQLAQDDGVYEGYLLLDEYSAHMDIYYQRYTLEMLKRLVHDCPLGILLIGHELNLALHYYDQCLLLKNAHAIGFGLSQNILTDQLIYQAFNTKVRQLEVEGQVHLLME